MDLLGLSSLDNVDKNNFIIVMKNWSSTLSCNCIYKCMWALPNKSTFGLWIWSENKYNSLPVDVEIHQGFPLALPLYITFMDLFIFCSIQDMGVSGGVRFVFALLKTMWFSGINKTLD